MRRRSWTPALAALCAICASSSCPAACSAFPFGRPNGGRALDSGRRGRPFPGRPNSFAFGMLEAPRAKAPPAPTGGGAGKPGIIIDYDTKGNVVGIEVLDASDRVENPRALEYAVTG